MVSHLSQNLRPEGEQNICLDVEEQSCWRVGKSMNMGLMQFIAAAEAVQEQTDKCANWTLGGEYHL